MSDFLQTLNKHVQATPDKVCSVWLDHRAEEHQRFTYSDVWTQSTLVCKYMQSNMAFQDRVVLLFGQESDFVASFIACLRTGVIAVPAYPPDPSKVQLSKDKLSALIDDCQPSICICSNLIYTFIHVLGWPSAFANRITFVSFRSVLAAATSIGTMKSNDMSPVLLSDPYQHPQITNDTLAFLQYTSGSTGNPKGVMISHGNIYHNVMVQSRYFHHNVGYEPAILADLTIVTWAPMFHDFGLITGCLVGMLSGHTNCVISPVDFLKNPCVWILAMSRFKHCYSLSPNFGLRLVARKWPSFARKHPVIAQKADLSGLIAIACAAEPIDLSTPQIFYDTFKHLGLRRNYFGPSYGQAEHVVCISSIGEVPDYDQYPRGPMGSEAENVFTHWYKGPTNDVFFRIVHPETHHEMPFGETGEIWVHSPSVGMGYWNKDELTNEVFHARIVEVANDSVSSSERELVLSRHYLRTGDQGSMDAVNNLFICGRIKDMIILNGRNIYPQDLENSLSYAFDDMLRPGCSVVVRTTAKYVLPSGEPSSTSETLEGVDVMAELRKPSRYLYSSQLEDLASKINFMIQQDFGVKVYRIALLEPKQLLKTSSGKVRRRDNRTGLENGSLMRRIAFLYEKTPPIVPSWNTSDNPRAPKEQDDLREDATLRLQSMSRRYHELPMDSRCERDVLELLLLILEESISSGNSNEKDAGWRQSLPQADDLLSKSTENGASTNADSASYSTLTLTNCGLDSVSSVAFCELLQEHFQMHITPQELLAVPSLQVLVRAVLQVSRLEPNEEATETAKSSTSFERQLLKKKSSQIMGFSLSREISNNKVNPPAKHFGGSSSEASFSPSLTSPDIPSSSTEAATAQPAEPSSIIATSSLYWHSLLLVQPIIWFACLWLLSRCFLLPYWLFCRLVHVRQLPVYALLTEVIVPLFLPLNHRPPLGRSGLHVDPRDSRDDPFTSPFVLDGHDGSPSIAVFQNVYLGVAVALPLCFFLFVAIAAVSAVVLKWICIGRIVAGRYPLWGWYHLRLYTVDLYVTKLVEPLLRLIWPDRAILFMWYTALGAKIALSSVHSLQQLEKMTHWDLINIDEDCRFVSNVLLKPDACDSSGVLDLRPIQIQRACTLGRDTLVLGGAIVPSYTVTRAFAVVNHSSAYSAEITAGTTSISRDIPRSLNTNGGYVDLRRGADLEEGFENITTNDVSQKDDVIPKQQSSPWPCFALKTIGIQMLENLLWLLILWIFVGASHTMTSDDVKKFSWRSYIGKIKLFHFINFLGSERSESR